MRITALTASAALLIGGAALTAAAVDVADPATTCAAPADCGSIESYLDDNGIITPGDVDAIRDDVSLALVDGGGSTLATVGLLPGTTFFEKFTNVPAGTYTLRITIPAGYKVAELTKGGAHWAAGSLTSDPITVTTYDVQRPVSIVPDVALGTLNLQWFSDMDRDGNRDPDEGGLGGFTANVYDATDTRVASLSTEGTTVLQPGDYRVTLAQPGGWANLSGTFGTADTGTVTITADQTTTVTYALKDNADCTSTPARCGAMLTYVFTENGSGVKNPQPDVQVALVDAINGQRLAYATTGADGQVRFSAVPGWYKGEVVNASGLDIVAGDDYDPATHQTAQFKIATSPLAQLQVQVAPGTGIGDGPIDEPESGTVQVIGFVDLDGDGQYTANPDEMVPAKAVISSATMSPLTVSSGHPVTVTEGLYTYDVSDQPAGYRAVGSGGTFTLDGTYILYVEARGDRHPTTRRRSRRHLRVLRRGRRRHEGRRRGARRPLVRP